MQHINIRAQLFAAKHGAQGLSKLNFGKYYIHSEEYVPN